MSQLITSPVAEGNWNEERDVITMPDGSLWGARRIIDWYRRREGETRFPESAMHVGQLRKLTLAVKKYSAKSKPHKIRMTKVKSPLADGLSIGVWHLGDAAAVNAWCKAAHRQQATEGKFKGQWFISPGRVAEKLGVDKSGVPTYRKHGIPWMPRVEKGCRAGQKQKPTTEIFVLHGNKEHFWLEEDVQRFKLARESLPEQPPEGFTTIKAAAEKGDISVHHGANKRRSKEIGYVEMPLKIHEKIKGKRVFTFTSMHRVIPTGNLDKYTAARVKDPVPSDKMTAPDAARILRVTPTTIYRWIREGAHHLHGQKPTVTPGILLWKGNIDGRPNSQLRKDCHYLVMAQVRTIFENMFPGKPWPLEEPAPAYQGGTSTNGTRPIPAPSDALPRGSAEQPAAIPSAPRKRRGPRRSAITQEVYTACYDLMAEGKLLRSQIVSKLRKDFTDTKYLSSLPKSDSEVTIYARRRALDPDNPRPWPIPSRRP